MNLMKQNVAVAFLGLCTGLFVMADPEPNQISVQKTDWWLVFDHPGLTDAINQGLGAHPDLESAMARIRAAEANVDAARANGRPQASIYAGIRTGREQSVETGGIPADIDPFFGSAQLSWELDLLGRLEADVEAAAAQTAAAEADRAGVRLMLSLAIARTYISFALAQEEVELLREELNLWERIASRIQRQVDAGIREQDAMERSSASSQSAQHALMLRETQADQLRARLKTLQGGVPLRAENNLSLSTWSLPSPPALEEGARRVQRPDVVQAFYMWQSARGKNESESRNRWPTLSLILSASGKGEDVEDAKMWSAWAGPVLSLPIWNPGLKASRMRARAEEQANKSAFESVSLRAVEELERAWAVRSRSVPMFQHMESRKTSLQDILDSNERKFQAGLTDENSVLQSKINASQAARSVLQWRAAALLAHTDLIAALGG